jgi:hypothetical protein
MKGNDHWLTSSFKLMLDGFGFDWFVVRFVFPLKFILTLILQAPGEAEATLSMMTTDGVPVRVDAILTDDSDSFVFGASVVLRMYVYTALSIRFTNLTFLQSFRGY